jgi:hypothetical protein
MTIRTMGMPGLWTACLLAMSASCFGQTKTVDTQQRAENLSGSVYSEDAGGARQAMGDVIVAECTRGFKSCMMMSKTDEQGRFSIASEQNTRVHYLQFLSPGFSESQVTVTLAKNGGKLNVRLVSSL